jgi:bifunctional non-homologous end joining protein LigD
MTITVYNKKRNFRETSEPKGEVKKVNHAFPVFVVQKHDASHLHYDFRLEMEGVLKSWAVPKGPSMNPNDKRLAMMVEDHPFGYKDFEGIIPEGNYGAGTVIVWDNGTYANAHPVDPGKNGSELIADLNKGHLKIFLNGKKLKGGFSLIRMKEKKGNAWMLIKAKDSYAGKEDILKKDKSVLSNRTLEEIEEGHSKENKRKKQHSRIESLREKSKKELHRRKVASNGKKKAHQY